MKAIIIPLNKFFFHFEKYDGKTSAFRFFSKYPKVLKVLQSRAFVNVFAWILLILFLPIFGVLILKTIVERVKKKDRVDLVLARMTANTEKWKILKRKDIHPTLNKFRKNKFSIFIYYTPDMIPQEKEKQNSFYARLELMKQNLKFEHVLEAKSKDDIEETIMTFGIDPAQSFFMSDGRIDLSNFRRLEEVN